MLLRILCCVLALGWLSANASEIYKTRDKDGNWVFSDKPSGDRSEQVKLPPINTLPPTQAVPVYAPPRTNTQTPDEPYQLSIISPRENVTIPPGQRDLAIAVNLDRPLDPNHLLVYFINGELLEETRSTSIVVQDVIRGSHTLTVEVVDPNGASLGVSPQVVVNVIRPSLLSPLRATPKPGG